MLENRLIIDNDDAFSTYGLFVRDNGLAPLIGWPQFKKIAANNWYEENGIEADLTSPVLDGRQVQLQLYAMHDLTPSDLAPILSMLRASVYHTFRVPTLGVKFVLRYVSNGSVGVNNRFDSLTLTLAEDFDGSIAGGRSKPAMGEEVTLDFGNNTTTSFRIAVPDIDSVPFSGYDIDGYDMSRFGMMVTKGTLDQMQRFDKVKEAMKRSSNYVEGVQYDSAGTVYSNHDDVTMKLHIRTDTVVDFWNRWYALFAILMKSGEHILQGAGRRYRCYYKSMKVDKLYPLANGGVWCDFSVTMAVLGSMPIQIFGLTDNNVNKAIIDDDNVIISIIV